MESYFKCFVTVLLTLEVFFAANAEQGQFPCGYEYFSEAEGWLKIHLEGKTWSQASRICDLEGAVLASPATDPMKYSLMKLMDANRVDSNDVYTYDNPRVIHTGMHPTGYTLDNRTQQCYKFYRSRSTWFEAASTCITEGGYLAIINSAMEAQVIQDIFANNPADFISGWAWKDSAFLGFRANTQRKWITMQGQSLAAAGYDGWAPGEPNNARGDEFCGSVGRNGKLYDDPCTRKLPYICERRPAIRCKKPKIIEVVTFLSPQDKADAIRNHIDSPTIQ